MITELKAIAEPLRKDIGVAVNKALRLTLHESSAKTRKNLVNYLKRLLKNNRERCKCS